MQSPSRRLILASGSTTRRDMLQAAGVTFDVSPADVDEPALRQDLFAVNKDMTAAEIAEALAAAKARDVSRKYPDADVIGSDQVLDLDGEILSKPGNPAGVLATLQKLSGKSHSLHSAVAIARNDRIVWTKSDTARLTMRTLSPSFIECYIARAGDGVLYSVGAYQIECLGSQLFEQIEGDHFTILGMPLLPLLGELRSQGILAA